MYHTLWYISSDLSTLDLCSRTGLSGGRVDRIGQVDRIDVDRIGRSVKRLVGRLVGRSYRSVGQALSRLVGRSVSQSSG